MSFNDTVKRLLTLSADQSAPEGERTAATNAIKRLLDAHPELQQTVEGFGKDHIISRDFRFKKWEEEMLLAQIGRYLGLEVYNLRSPAANRPIKWLRIKGDQRLVDLVKPLHKDYKDKLHDTLVMFTYGWLFKTLPGQKTEDEDKREYRKLTPEEERMIRLGHSVAKQHRIDAPELSQSNPKGAISDGD